MAPFVFGTFPHQILIPMTLMVRKKKNTRNINFKAIIFLIEPSVAHGNLVGHTDAVWGITYNQQRNQLLSCGADSTVRLWSASDMRAPLLSTYVIEKGNSDPDQILNCLFTIDCFLQMEFQHQSTLFMKQPITLCAVLTRPTASFMI